MGGVVALDFTKYPIPTQAFIGGKYVDCKDTGKHELRSSVNDEVLTSGTSPRQKRGFILTSASATSSSI